MNKIEAFTEVLRRRIAEGEFGFAGRIPSVRDFEEQYNDFGRETIIKGIDRLRAEGVLIARGRASFVVPQRVVRIMTTDIPSLAESIGRLGLIPQTQNLALEETSLPSEIAEMFGLTSGQWCLYRFDRQGTAQIPYRIYKMWYVAPLVKQFVQEIRERPDVFIIPRIVQMLGHEQQKVSENIRGRLPTSEEAALLSITSSSPILEVRRANFTPDGQVMIVAQHLFNASLVDFEYSFYR